MKCPQCGLSNDRVLESRENDDHASIRRRRECLDCKSRYTTYERLEPRRLLIVKKNGERESYDRQKLANGLYRACEKRPLPVDVIEQTIDRVERAIMTEASDEVTSQRIGELVMHELALIDEVAYVRFASVYRSFTTAESFEREIAAMKKSRS